MTIRTYQWGGGTNAAGTAIPSGGFDPVLTLIEGKRIRKDEGGDFSWTAYGRLLRFLQQGFGERGGSWIGSVDFVIWFGGWKRSSAVTQPDGIES